MKFRIPITIFIAAIILFGNAQKLSEEIKSEMFYGKINETLREPLKMYPKRIKCIIKELKSKRTMEVIESFYNFTYGDNGYMCYFGNHTEVMKVLQPIIDSASFGCTIIGFCAIFLICTVLLTVVACVACLHK
ncbi:hypothetical protein ACKWTF_003751 [Chironomus riparius]